jgi:hypothetical protein
MNRRFGPVARLSVLLVSICSFCVGCGSGFQFVPVRGTVTLDRKPLDGALVYYYPVVAEGAEVPPYSSGKTDAAGVYELMSRTDVAGAVVGPHKVVVMFPSSGDREGAKRPNIPLDYRVAASTKLTVDVKPETADYPLALVSK